MLNPSRLRKSLVPWVLVAVACGLGDPSATGTSSVVPPIAPPEIIANDGRLYLQIDVGTVLRDAPNAAGAATGVTASVDTLRAVAREGNWYRVQRDEPPRDGWLFLEPATAHARALRIGTGGGGRPSVAPSEDVVAVARRHLEGGGRDLRCGPYRLLTDVADGSLLSACQRVGTALDDHVHRLYGVAPEGEPHEAIFLFERREAFRGFGTERGTFRSGYAAYARGAEGYLAAFVGGQPAGDMVQTLTHELTHLVLRRALGSDLPRWLSEGLADGVGDAATMNGLAAPRGAVGVEAELQRLGYGDQSGQVGDLKTLLTKDERAFDTGTVNYDYELSGVFVRYLLVDAQRAERLRAVLSGLARGEPYDAELFRRALGGSWAELDQRFRTWVRSHP